MAGISNDRRNWFDPCLGFPDLTFRVFDLSLHVELPEKGDVGGFSCFEFAVAVGIKSEC